MTVTHDPPFDFGHLIDVRPVLSTASAGEMTVTIDSVERYQHGFILVLWTQSRRQRMGLMAIAAQDDRGNSYAGRMEAGYGGGDEQSGWTNREVYSFTPALDPLATRLDLDITPVRTLRYDAPRQVKFDPADILGGPYHLSLALNPASAGSIAQSDALAKTVFGPPGAQYTPSTLVSVIPVAQRQTSNGLEITILSVERYADGFSLVMRTDYPAPFVMFDHRFGWQVDDGMGGQYRSGGIGGSGGGIPGQTTSWRIDNPFTPALDPEATTLTLRIEQVRLRERGGEWSTVNGPWEFKIGL